MTVKKQYEDFSRCDKFTFQVMKQEFVFLFKIVSEDCNTFIIDLLTHLTESMLHE